MITEASESEKRHSSSRVDNFDSVWRELVTDEVESQVNILKEEWDWEETIEELSWGAILNDFHPNLLLLAVGALNKVIRVTEVHVIWPHASKLVLISAVVWLENISLVRISY